jgi:hypothetical protein
MRRWRHGKVVRHEREHRWRDEGGRLLLLAIAAHHAEEIEVWHLLGSLWHSIGLWLGRSLYIPLCTLRWLLEHSRLSRLTETEHKRIEHLLLQ